MGVEAVETLRPYPPARCEPGAPRGANWQGWTQRLYSVSHPTPRPRPPDWRHYQGRLDAARTAPVNFGQERLHELVAAGGWRVDQHMIALASELPGPPLPDGLWAIGVTLFGPMRFRIHRCSSAYSHPRSHWLGGRGFSAPASLASRSGSTFE